MYILCIFLNNSFQANLTAIDITSQCILDTDVKATEDFNVTVINKTVYIRGGIFTNNNTVPNTAKTLFTLPALYRPTERNEHFTCVAGIYPAVLLVNKDGTVQAMINGTQKDFYFGISFLIN